MPEFSFARTFRNRGLLLQTGSQFTNSPLDATDVFVSLISQKYGKTNTKEYLAKRKDMSYNEDEVQKSQIPSGLCG